MLGTRGRIIKFHMPGIAGIIGIGSNEENGVAVDAMVKCLVHERFYKSGTYVNERQGLWIGWSCLEGSYSDCLPVWNEKGDICLIFCGENFADRAEMERLRADGHEFDSDNASFLVHLYEETGFKFLERLNGGFSGVLVDIREHKVLLFNDRYGLYRIYYHENENGFYFSSEAKSLLRILPNLRQLDYRSLGEQYSCGCVLQNRTLFSGVSLVPGGSAWTFAHGRGIKKDSYFEKEVWENQPGLSAVEYYERLKETWKRILPRYFQGKERVGLSLTGGVDSRMILAWAPCPPGTLPCYTFGGRYRDCADVRLAREIARICQQPHETIPVDREFLSEFPQLAEKTIYVSDGAMDVTGSIDLYIQRKAREFAPVRLSGVYGGEILRSIVVFKPGPPWQNLLDPEFARQVQDAALTYATELQCHRHSYIAFKQAPWYMTSKFAVERSQVTFRTPYFDNDLVALAYQAPPNLMNNEPQLRLIADGNPTLRRIGTDRAISLRSIPGVTQALHLFQEFTFKAEYAYDYGMPQWLARIDHAFAPFHLERLFLGRHKFSHFRVWYRDELSQYLRDVLLDSRTRNRPYLQGSRLEAIVKGHLGGYRNYTLEIQSILTSENIERQLIDRR